MADVRHSNYGTHADIMTTGLNALADGARAITSALDNTTDLHLYDDLELEVTFGSSPTANRAVEIYLIPSVDGTNYTDGSDSVVPPASAYVGSFSARAVGTAQRLALLNVPLPPGLFKYVLRNNTGQAFSASGHVLARRPHSLTVA